MTTDAADRTREAWGRYADRLRGLQGQEYDEAESGAWADLQAELHAIDDALTVGAGAPGA